MGMQQFTSNFFLYKKKEIYIVIFLLLFGIQLQTPKVHSQSIPLSEIAFYSNTLSSTGEDIYIINTDGTNIRQLTNHPLNDYTPRWSPDAQVLAFGTNRDGNNEIYLMNIDGSN